MELRVVCRKYRKHQSIGASEMRCMQTILTIYLFMFLSKLKQNQTKNKLLKNYLFFFASYFLRCNLKKYIIRYFLLRKNKTYVVH